jgi:diguanylate cyclase (GGDEF)-like protein
MASEARDARADRVLVVDDHPEVVAFVADLLELEGFEVFKAYDGEEGLAAAIDIQPDVVLLDIMMPKLDGLEVCARLRNHPRTKYLCVIMLTAKADVQDKIDGLRAGADDFVTKPFDPGELVERVRSALRRSREMAALNPLTGMPGNEEVRSEVESRLADNNPFALLHVDIDDFKAFNDHYGILRGDAAIVLLADCLNRARDVLGDPSIFLGHVGGDDMVLIVEPGLSETIAKEIITRWDEGVADLYDEQDLARGHIEVIDRYSQLRQVPIMSLSIGIAGSHLRDFKHYWEMGDAVARLKSIAKQQPGSAYQMDRRGGELRAAEERPRPTKVADLPQELRTVLVVDDDPMIREVLRIYCETTDFSVIEAEDGVQAYQIAKRHRPLLIVLDFKMPELNGRYAAEVIREAVPDAAIIALSAVLDRTPVWADIFVPKHEIHLIPALLRDVLVDKGHLAPHLLL